MEYIKGKDLLTFIKEYGEDWIEVLMLQLLTNLAELHQKGWVFCDLKPENLPDAPFILKCNHDNNSWILIDDKKDILQKAEDSGFKVKYPQQLLVDYYEYLKNNRYWYL